jgi:hypothetical protein
MVDGRWSKLGHTILCPGQHDTASLCAKNFHQGYLCTSSTDTAIVTQKITFTVNNKKSVSDEMMFQNTLYQAETSLYINAMLIYFTCQASLGQRNVTEFYLSLSPALQGKYRNKVPNRTTNASFHVLHNSLIILFESGKSEIMRTPFSNPQTRVNK